MASNIICLLRQLFLCQEQYGRAQVKHLGISPAQGMTLHYQDQMEGPAYLRLSIPEMERVFNNIINNSIKYKPKETGNLTITLSAVEKMLCFALPMTAPACRKNP